MLSVLDCKCNLNEPMITNVILLEYNIRQQATRHVNSHERVQLSSIRCEYCRHNTEYLEV